MARRTMNGKQRKANTGRASVSPSMRERLARYRRHFQRFLVPMSSLGVDKWKYFVESLFKASGTIRTRRPVVGAFRRTSGLGTGRLVLEHLEHRRVLATFSETGTALNIDLNEINQSLTIVAHPSTYTFTLNAGAAWHGASSPHVSVSGTTLTVTSAGLSAFNDIIIGDSAPENRVFFANSGLSPYSDNFRVTLDSSPFEVNFSGATSFTANNSIDVITTRNISLNFGSSLTTADGNIRLSANQQPVPTSGDFVGIAMNGNSTVQSTGHGVVTVQGRGGDAGIGGKRGIHVDNGGKIIGSRSGLLTVDGQGGNATSHSNFGIIMMGSGSLITSNGGDVFVAGTGGGVGSSVSNIGIVVSASGQIMAGGSGSVTVDGRGGNRSGSGTSNHGVEVSGRIDSSGGNVSVYGTGGGANTSGFNRGVMVSGAGTIRAGGIGTVTVVGQGGNQSGTSGDLNNGVEIVGAGSFITSSGGDVFVTGTGGGSGSSFQNRGVWVYSSGQITAGGNGNVAIVGAGGNLAGVVSTNIGIQVSNAGSLITSNGGNVALDGTGGGTGGSFNSGILVDGGADIIATGSGGVTIVGRGGSRTASSGGTNYGVQVTGSGSSIASNGGDVSVTGTGGGAGSSASNYGVYVESAGEISAGGSGRVDVTGQGGNQTGTGSSNFGVSLSTSGSSITSNGGTVTVTGIGGGNGTGTDNRGVNIGPTCQISAGGMGEVRVIGNGGNTTGTGSGSNRGVHVTSGAITSSGGNVSVIGTGGGVGSGTHNYGIAVEGTTGLISAGNSGTITVVGQGGNPGGSGGQNSGIFLNNNGSISATWGNIHVEGAGYGPGGRAIELSGTNSISTTNGGTITLVGDSMSLSSTSSITTGASSSVSVRPRTSGVATNLGTVGDSAPGPLNLTDSELDRIVTGNINVGDLNAGNLAINSAISRTAATNMTLATAAGAFVSPVATGTDLDLLGGSIVMYSGSTLRINIAGPVEDSQYSRLRVNGTVNLNNANLSLTGSHVSGPGHVFNIVSAANVVGTFNGLPDNSIIVFNGVNHRINYTSTSVTLTANPNTPPTIAANLAAVVAIEGGSAVNSGTFSDAQGNATVTLTASIGTITQDNSNGTWNWTFNAIDGPAGPLPVTITATDDQNVAANTTFTYAVNNVPPTISLSGDATVNEGSPYTLNLGAIHDPGNDLISGYRIEWGDGHVDLFSGSPANTVAVHTFADGPATHSQTVRVTDEDGTFIAGFLEVQVLNVAPTIELSGNSSEAEGREYRLNLGHIFDPGNDTVSSYRIDWGDGIVESFSGNPANTIATHIYADDNAATQILVSLTDEDGQYDGAGSLLVNIFNISPAITLSGNAAVDEGSEYSLNLGMLFEPGADAIANYEIDWGDGTQTSGSGNPANSVATHTYADGLNDYTLTLTVSDEDGFHMAGSHAVQVRNVRPTIALSGDAFVDEGSEFTLNLGSLFDPGVDTVTDYLIDWGDGHNTGPISGNPANTLATHVYEDGSNLYQIRVSLIDEDGMYGNAGEFTVFVDNLAPLATDDGALITEDDAALAVAVLGNDTDPAGIHDPLSIVSIDTSGTRGLVVLDGGQILYDPRDQFNYLRDGETATDTFTYTIDDGDGGTATATVTITITGRNDTATITGNHAGFTDEDTSTPVSGLLTVEDFDAGENSAAAQLATAGSYGSFSIDASGNWTYTVDNAAVQYLPAGQQVSDSFTVVSLDGTASQLVTITIEGRNDVATITGDDAGLADEDSTAVITGGLAVSDVDQGETASVAQSGTSGNYGSFSIDANGNWSYAINNAAVQYLAAGQQVSDSFTVVSQDGTASQLVTITIEGRNDAPVVSANIVATATEDDSPFSVDLLAGASDVDTGTTLHTENLQITSGNASGVTVGSNALNINPAAWNHLAVGESAVVQYSFDVVDQLGARVSRTATITIVGANDSPTANGDFPDFGATVINGNAANDRLGASVSIAGDVNGDGYADYIVGAQLSDTINGPDTGSARVYSGRNNTLLYTFIGDSTGDQFGVSVSGAGDVNNDGFDDLIVGASGDDNFGSDSGSARVFSGRTGGVLFTFFGDSANDSFGLRVAGAGDVNNDGFDDLVVGAPGDDNTGSSSGSARVFSGQNGSILYTVNGDSADDQSGFWVSGLGDVNNDGFDDFLVGAPADDNTGLNSGSARLYSGQNGSILYTINGQAASDQFGAVIKSAGDVNGDQIPDFIVGAAFSDVNGSNSGSASVHSGSTGNVIYTFHGAAADDQFGFSVGAAGDIDSDGFDDVIVGARLHDANGTNSGRVYIFSGQNGSLLHTSDGVSGGDEFGFSVAGGGDFNGDGRADWLAGAWRDDNTGTDSGSASVFRNPFGWITNEDTPFNTASVLGNDTDTDLTDVLLVAALDTTGTRGLVTDNGDGTFSWQPNGQFDFLTVGQSATDTFRYTISDGHGGTSTAVVTIRIDGRNDVATFTGDAAKQTTEDTLTPVTGSLTVSDADQGQGLAVAQSGTAGNYGSFSINAQGNWTYSLNNVAVQHLAVGQQVTDSFTVVSQDGSASQLVTITVEGRNDTATIAGTASGSTDEDSSTQVSGVLSVSDVDQGQNLAVAQSGSVGSYGTFAVDASGNWSYVVDNTAVQYLPAGQQVSDSFTVVSLDGTASQLVTITIEGRNDTATISGHLAGLTDEDLEHVAPTGSLSVADVDEDQNGIVPHSGTTGSYGSFYLNARGDWHYSLNVASVQHLTAGQQVTDTFTVTSLDGTASQLVTITIEGRNDAATISGTASGSTDEDAATPVSGVLSVSDVDQGENQAIAQTATAGSYGTFAIDASGNWTYTVDNAAVQYLPAGQQVSDSFTVISQDGTASQLVTVTINGRNDVATISGTASGSTDEDSATPVSGVLSVSDVDQGENQAIAQTGSVGSYGSFSIDASGNWSYTANNAVVQYLPAGQQVTDTFTVMSLDGSASQLVTITLEGRNDAASIAGTGSGVADEDSTAPVSGALTVSDVDQSQNQPIAQTATAGSFGTFSIDANGNWSYVVNNAAVQYLPAGQQVNDSFTVVSQDATASQLVTITIEGRNDAPTDISLDNSSVLENAPGAVVGNLSSSDPDTGDSHTYSVNDARFEVVSGQLKLKTGVSLDFETEPSVNLTITATDAGSLVYSEGFSIGVTNVNEGAPTANAGGPYSVNEGSSVQLDGRGSSDPDGTIALYEWDLNYDGVTFSPDVSGANASRPTFSASGLDGGNARTVALRVTDNQGNVSQISTQSVEILNVAPTISLTGSNSVDEGAVYTLTLGAVVDPGLDIVTHYVIHWDATHSTTYAAADLPTNRNVTYVYDDNATPTITVDLIDEDGTHVSAGSRGVTVRNVNPLITYVTGSESITDRGTYAQFVVSGKIVDAPGDSWTAFADFGDGTGDIPVSVNPDGTFVLNHDYQYTTNKAFKVVVTATDDDGGSDVRRGTRNVYAVGSLGNDNIEVNFGSVIVVANGLTLGTFDQNLVDNIVVVAGPGNDSIRVDRALMVDALLIGGGGNDSLEGGGGFTILDGGDGDNVLVLGSGGNQIVPPVGMGSLSTQIAENSQSSLILAPASSSVTFTGNGPDNALFELTPDNQLRFIHRPDFESPMDADGDGVYQAEVEITNPGEGSYIQSIQIAVSNLASVTGSVYVDVNGNGLFEANEPGIDGVIVELLDDMGLAVLDDNNTPIVTVTSDGGYYQFEDLPAGTYRIREVQPTGVGDGLEMAGSGGGTIIANDMIELPLGSVDLHDYVFAELGLSVTAGDTAGIGFWQNKHGQELIAQGGAALAAWLTANFENVFGNTFVDGIGGDNGNEVALFYRDQLFKQKALRSAGPAKVEAQFMATALATYFTSSNLAGNVAAAYGFNVTQTGIGTRIVNVGNSGAAFGVANNTNMTIMQLLQATNDLTDQPENINGAATIYDRNGDGVIDQYEAWLRTLANEIYAMINGN